MRKLFGWFRNCVKFLMNICRFWLSRCSVIFKWCSCLMVISRVWISRIWVKCWIGLRNWYVWDLEMLCGSCLYRCSRCWKIFKLDGCKWCWRVWVVRWWRCLISLVRWFSGSSSLWMKCIGLIRISNSSVNRVNSSKVNSNRVSSNRDRVNSLYRSSCSKCLISYSRVRVIWCNSFSSWWISLVRMVWVRMRCWVRLVKVWVMFSNYLVKVRVSRCWVIKGMCWKFCVRVCRVWWNRWWVKVKVWVYLMGCCWWMKICLVVCVGLKDWILIIGFKFWMRLMFSVYVVFWKSCVVGFLICCGCSWNWIIWNGCLNGIDFIKKEFCSLWGFLKLFW